MSIDWNTAPEGATHWEPEGRMYRAGWMKKEWGKWFWWSKGSKEWVFTSNVTAKRETTFEARPQESWDGQGLPPVGIEIEANFPVTDVTGTHYHWRRVIVAVAGIPGAERECLVYDAENTKPAWVDEFRPLPTPEQIAAEERSKECDRIFVILSSVEREGNRSDMAEALYDAGYRRQEEGK